jgi:31-O-methyltransferase
VTTLRPLRLQNGMIVEQVGGAIETHAIFREVFVDDVYVRHGISIGPGATVIDVGANIGLFTMRVCKDGAATRVLAVEPVPLLFLALQKNVAANNPHGANITAKNVAVGAAAGSLQIQFYPRATGFSTSRPDERAQLGPQLLNDLLGHYEGFRQKHSIIGALFYPFRKPLLQVLIRRRLRGAVSVLCPVMTLSKLIDDENIARVDLLKIDVEGAELDVLRGIEDRHWGRIQQVVLEVQDFDGKKDAVVALLKERGLSSTVEGRGRVHHVYARRPTR